MTYMLDTNICIFAIKHKPEAVIKAVTSHSASDICISSITYAELMHGVEKSQARMKNLLALKFFLSSITILPFGMRASEEYGKIVADLQSKGTPIGPMDTLISAHARSENLILVTNNTREFQRVIDLELEDWTRCDQ